MLCQLRGLGSVVPGVSLSATSGAVLEWPTDPGRGGRLAVRGPHVVAEPGKRAVRIGVTPKIAAKLKIVPYFRLVTSELKLARWFAD